MTRKATKGPACGCPTLEHTNHPTCPLYVPPGPLPKMRKGLAVVVVEVTGLGHFDPKPPTTYETVQGYLAELPEGLTVAVVERTYPSGCGGYWKGYEVASGAGMGAQGPTRAKCLAECLRIVAALGAGYVRECSADWMAKHPKPVAV